MPECCAAVTFAYGVVCCVVVSCMPLQVHGEDFSSYLSKLSTPSDEQEGGFE
jgi:hypothetical protein